MNRKCLKRKFSVQISRTSKIWDPNTSTSRSRLRLDIHMLDKQSQKPWNQKIKTMRLLTKSTRTSFSHSWRLLQAQRWTKATSSSKAPSSFRRKSMTRRSWVISRVSLPPPISGQAKMAAGSSLRKLKRPPRATRCHLSRLSVPSTWFHNFNRLSTIRSRNWNPIPIPQLWARRRKPIPTSRWITPTTLWPHPTAPCDRPKFTIQEYFLQMPQMHFQWSLLQTRPTPPASFTRWKPKPTGTKSLIETTESSSSPSHKPFKIKL